MKDSLRIPSWAPLLDYYTSHVQVISTEERLVFPSGEILLIRNGEDGKKIGVRGKLIIAVHRICVNFAKFAGKHLR